MSHALRCRLLSLALALPALLVLVTLFSPQYRNWREMGLGTPAGDTPEAYRAPSALSMLHSPFSPTLREDDVILRYRLLFPLVGYATRMPEKLFLALPWVGCLLCLAYAGQILSNRGARSWEAFAAILTFGAAAWFFTSTGWLSYPDAWIILGLLLVSLSPSLPAAITAAFLTGWADERFVLAVPLALLLRIALARIDPSLRWTIRQWAFVLGAFAAFLAIRGGLTLAARSSQLTQFQAVRHGGVAPAEVPATVWLLALWNGIRAGWLFVAITFVLLAKQIPLRLTLALALVTLGTLAGSMGIVWDVGRSASLIAPLVLAGMLLLQAKNPLGFRKVVIVAAVLALVLPAHHVLTKFQWRIRTVATEWRKYQTPPGEMYASLGLAAVNARDLDGAKRNFDAAIIVDPNSFRARLSRASWYLNHGDLASAEADARVALEAQPDSANALLVLGTILQRQGHPTAADVLTKAIEKGGDAWPSRSVALRRLSQVTNASSSTLPTTVPQR